MKRLLLLLIPALWLSMTTMFTGSAITYATAAASPLHAVSKKPAASPGLESAQAHQGEKAYPQCLRYDTTHAYVCLQGGIPHDGLIYVWEGLFTRTFYWHPATGDAVVTESYDCYTDDARPAYGHVSCSQAFPGMSYVPRYDRRTITVGPDAALGIPQGCVVTDYNVWPSTNPWPPITTCHPMNGDGNFPATAGAVKSVADYAAELQLVPGEW